MIVFLDAIGNFWDRLGIIEKALMVFAFVLNCALTAWTIVDFFR